MDETKVIKSNNGSWTVLKVENYDPTKLSPEQIKGDKVYGNWQKHYKLGLRFGYNNNYDIQYCGPGAIKDQRGAILKVGDRVTRGFSWNNDVFGNEDGHGIGTVVSIQFLLQVSGLIVKVKWDNNNHTNMYAWGNNENGKPVYDIKFAT